MLSWSPCKPQLLEARRERTHLLMYARSPGSEADTYTNTNAHLQIFDTMVNLTLSKKEVNQKGAVDVQKAKHNINPTRLIAPAHKATDADALLLIRMGFLLPKQSWMNRNARNPTLIITTLFIPCLLSRSLLFYG
jgi:hypothetical protein